MEDSSQNQRLDEIPYFSRLKDIGKSLFCPTDKIGIDAYLPLLDRHGNTLVILFLDDTTSALDLSSYKGDFEVLRIVWGNMYKEILERNQEEREKLTLMIENLADVIVDNALFTDSATSEQEETLVPQMSFGDVGANESSEQEFGFLAEAVSRTMEIYVPSEVLERSREIAKQALAIETGILPVKGAELYGSDDVERRILKELRHFKKVIADIIESNPENPDSAKQIIFGLLEKFVMKAARTAVRARQIEKIGTTDPLTGLPDRVKFTQDLREEYERSWSEKAEYSVLLIDIDYFSQINEANGRFAADWILCEVARCIKSCTRAYDRISRYGDDKFAVILPAIKGATACLCAHSIQKAIRNSDFIRGTVGKPITCTIGVSTSKVEETDRNSPVIRADESLRFAKDNERGTIARDEQIVTIKKGTTTMNLP